MVIKCKLLILLIYLFCCSVYASKQKLDKQDLSDLIMKIRNELSDEEHSKKQIDSSLLFIEKALSVIDGENKISQQNFVNYLTK